MVRGISIHIGLNYLDERHYGSGVDSLETCEQDAKDIQQIAIDQNFKSSFLLLSENATRRAVRDIIKFASRELTRGDMLLLSYSGHGGFVLDTNGDELDNLDETWCLYDGQLLDDELNQLWTLFAEGVRIFVISDSCHSGTVAKAPLLGMDKNSAIFQKKLLPYSIAKDVYLRNMEFYHEIEDKTGQFKVEDVKASVKLFAACQDPQVSYTMTFAKNSIFTEKIKEVWDAGRFIGNYSEFFEIVKDEVVKLDFLPTVQTPNLFSVGREDREFDVKKPFEL